jgi:sulfite dehydrogenase
MKKRGIIFLGAVLVSGAMAAPVEIKLPAEKSRLVESPLPGYALAQAMCATCHSADYLKMQPVSSRTYWKAAVTKMQKTYGGAIPDESVEALVDYLVKTYGNERTGAAGAAAKPAGK